MNISVRQLEIFILAGKLLNFSKVAKTLKMTPPAITKQINALEAECDLQLFEQVGRRMYLTENGRKALEQAQILDQSLSKFKKFVNSLSKNETVINLSLGHSFQNIIFQLINKFTKQNPDVFFNVYMDPRTKQLQALRENTRDLCIMAMKQADPDLDRFKIANMEFALVAGTESEHAEAKSITSANFKNDTFVLVTPVEGDDNTPNYYLEKWGLSDNRTIFLQSYSAVKEAIAAGLGIGFIPTSLLDKDVVALPVKGFTFSIPLYIAAYKHKKLAPIVKSFIQFVQTNLRTTKSA